MADIFVSYARSDRARIEQLAEALHDAGYSTWWHRQILGSDDFSANIERELTAAKAVVAAWSEAGSRSHRVKDEAQFAAGQGKLVAVGLDGTLPPMGLRQFHSINCSAWPDDATSWFAKGGHRGATTDLNLIAPESLTVQPRHSLAKAAAP
ncbi:MAG: toll/interleukin-1 receptor domain-containing protein [Gammaproteobacteria bacterium]